MSSVFTPQERRWVTLALLTELAILWDFMAIMPLGPQLSRELHLSPSELSWVVSSYTCASAAVGFGSGLALDLRKPERWIVPLLLLFAASTALAALSFSFWSLLLARAMAGAAGGLLWSACLALVTSVVSPERRGRAMATILSAYSVSAILGVPLALVIAERLGFRSPFLLIGALGLCLVPPLGRAVGGLQSGTLPEPLRAAPVQTALFRRAHLQRSLQEVVASGYLPRFGISGAVVFGGYCFIPILATYFTGNLGLAEGALAHAYLIGGVSTFITLRALGRAVDSMGARRVFLVTVLLSIAAFVALPRLKPMGGASLIAAFVSFMVASSSRMVPTIELISGDLPPERRGQFFALNTAVTDASASLASLASGALLGFNAAHQLTGMPMVSGLAVAASLLALGLGSQQPKPSSVHLSAIVEGAET